MPKQNKSKQNQKKKREKKPFQSKNLYPMRRAIKNMNFKKREIFETKQNLRNSPPTRPLQEHSKGYT